MDDKKRDIITCAQAYLAQNGFHAAGVEQLAAAAGITKRTLYNHFGSKDALILATMQYRDEIWLSRLQEFLKAQAPSHALMAYVDYLAHWLGQSDFYGCYFINASAEYSATEHPIHQYAAQHKQRVQDALEQRLPFLTEQSRLAVACIMAMGEGLIVTQQVSGNSRAAIDAARGLAHDWTLKLLDTP